MPRPRSNAISGPSDPRWRAPAELDLLRELDKPVVMDDTLKSFIKSIYKKPALMKGPDNVGDELYKLYNGIKPQAGNKLPQYEKYKEFVLELWNRVRSNPVLDNGHLQRERVRFSDLVDAVNTPDRIHDKYFSDFYYFPVRHGGAVYRVYANAKISYVPDVVAWLKFYITYSPGHDITAFKVAGPAALINGRQDAIVIYCKSSDAATKIAGELVKLRGHFNPQAVPMTKPVQRGIGVSTGAEPQKQATGFALKGKRAEKIQSFGTLRCELIAAAILNFNANKHVFGDSFEAFSKFVAVAFRGAGLDPAKPWN